MAQVAIAWILSKPGVSAPIVGTTSLSNLEDILGEYRSPLFHSTVLTSFLCAAGVSVELTEDEIKYLEEPYQPMPTIGVL